jgi:AcrR family transcriptional regulator
MVLLDGMIHFRLTAMDMNSRSYSMTNRSASVEETKAAIVRAAFELVGEKSNLEIVLADVAARSAVTVKTILRHFTSREGLFDAVSEFARNEVREERIAPVGDVDRAVDVIVDHYETRGDWVMRIIDQERTDTRIGDVVQQGRVMHRRWVETTFAPQLAAVPESERVATVDLLVVATDVYTWKLLRRDRGLDRPLTEQRIRTLVRAVLGTPREGA